MARTIRATYAWGGPGQAVPGEAAIAATLNQAPVEISVLDSASYPVEWTVVGRFQIRTPAGGLAGIVQEGPVMMRGGTLIYPRGRVLTVGPPNQMAAFNLLFESLPWVKSGTIQIATDPDIAYGGISNYGGGG